MLRAFAAGFALALASPALAEEAPAWRAVDASTGQIRDVGGLEQLARNFPDSGTVRLRMLQPLLEAEEVGKVMQTLEWLYDRGYVFSDVAQKQIPKLLEGVDPGRIAERLRAEAEVIEASEVVFTTLPFAGLTETVVRDAKTNALILTSPSEGSVWIVRPPDIEEGIGEEDNSGLSGMVFDAGRRHYWVSAEKLRPSYSNPGPYAGLASVCLALDDTCPASGKVFHRDAKSMNDLHAAEDGSIYSSDSIGGGIYRLAPSDSSLEQFIPSGTFRSPQGLATSADNTKLYVSDYRYGIAVIDLETREVSRLASDIPVILDGVDGLWRYGNELIAVQNGTSPMRISAFELSEDGMRVIGHRILEQAHSEWTEPLSGSIDGDSLIYIGNGQWDRYFEGELKPGMEALPTEIRRLPLARSAG